MTDLAPARHTPCVAAPQQRLGLVSGDALCVLDEEHRVVVWNRAAEELTGLAAEQVLGRPCWDVLKAHSERGSLVCHPDCSSARLAREGWPIAEQRLQIQTSDGLKPVDVTTISLVDGDERLLVRVLRPVAPPGRERTENGGARLTPRQLEVLRLLESGLSARTIAEHLGIAETTTRNHIHALLLELGAHSQLEAVARARRAGLIAGD